MKENNTPPINAVEDGNKIEPVKQSKINEISQEALEDRLLLSGLLIERTDELAKEALKRKKKREEEEIELHSGVKISIQQINDFVTARRQPYSPKFPNEIPFFKEMYRLLKWDDKDPNKYTKPSKVGGFINELIYYRFN